MSEILGGVAEWLRENGIKTSYDVAYEEWQVKVRLSNFGMETFGCPYFVIFSVSGDPVKICWLDDTNLVLQDAHMLHQSWVTSSYILKGTGIPVSFELADPGFLDILLSKV